MRIANEILMFFRSQKKLQGEVSLSDTLETDKDGNNLFLMDVMGVEDTMLEDLDTRESHIRVRQLVEECLTEREADIIRQRYGLGGRTPKTQRELAAAYGISRSYVSRRRFCRINRHPNQRASTTAQTPVMKATVPAATPPASRKRARATPPHRLRRTAGSWSRQNAPALTGGTPAGAWF